MWPYVLLIVSLPFIAFFIYLLYRGRVGHLIGVHLFLFENAYDKYFRESGSSMSALREALNVFKGCPVLNRLTDSDYDRFAEIIGPIPEAKKIVTTIVFKLDSRKIVFAFRDENFLREIEEAHGNG